MIPKSSEENSQSRVQKSGRAGIAQTKKNIVSVPLEVYTPVEELGGMFSNHVTAALRLYLKILKQGKNDA